MTGYGRAVQTWQDKTYAVELRALNSKFTDMRLKCPQNLREKENDLRKMVMDYAQRGKFEMSIDVTSIQGDDQFGLNVPLFKKYFAALRELSDELGFQDDNIMSAILRIPNVAASQDGEMSDEEWQVLQDTVNEALDNFQAFRLQEGEATGKDLEQRVGIITDMLDQVAPHEADRIASVRDRLYRSIEEHLGKDKIDSNRYEQEVLFYLEKMDINEEKMRLAQHCSYFLEVLGDKEESKGRKLNFISQEIGREINTLGAKAYSSDIQRLVVCMKDELEKIKEQIANIV